MSTVGIIVSLVAACGALVLALRGLRAQGVSFERKSAMAVAWAVIILVLAFVLTRAGF